MFSPSCTLFPGPKVVRNPSCSYVLGTNILPSYTWQAHLVFWQATFMAVIKGYSSPVVWFPCCRHCSVFPLQECCLLADPRSRAQWYLCRIVSQSQPAVHALCFICSNVQGLKVTFLCISKFLMANASIYFIFTAGSPERRDTCTGKSRCCSPRSPLVFHLYFHTGPVRE